MTDADRRVLADDPWFADLPLARQTALARRLRMRDLTNPERVYRRGDPPNGLYVLLAGEVRLVTYALEGAEFVGLILRPGRWFGELSVLDGGPRPHDAVPIRSARVGQISCAAIQELTAEDPELWREFARLTCGHQRRALAHIAATVEQRSDARLASLLLSAMDKQDPRNPIRMSQAQLASIMGLSRQRLNRLLATLRRTGTIRTSYGAINVLDQARLALAAGSDPARAAPPDRKR